MDRIGERLDGRDDDRVARMDAQRIDVLHRADGDARVVGVAHDLVFDLLPADEAALDHDLTDRAGAEAGADSLVVGVLGLDDAAARAAEREGRPDDRRQPDLLERAGNRDVAFRLRRAFDDPRRRVRLAEPVQQVAEPLAILGHLDRLERRAEQLHVPSLERARASKRDREVERRLAAESREQSIRALPRDHGLDRVDGERLEVDDIGDLRVGHDRRRVRVDEDGPNALGTERTTGLRAGVVEFGRLADDDRP